MAAAKKDFSAMQTGRVYEALEEATSKSRQTEASEEEQRVRMAEMRTQGRKGCKAPRVNIALTEDNYQFVKVMSKTTGRAMTQFINLVITAYRQEHPEIMAQARAFLETVNSGIFSADKEVKYTGGGADHAEADETGED